MNGCKIRKIIFLLDFFLVFICIMGNVIFYLFLDDYLFILIMFIFFKDVFL